MIDGRSGEVGIGGWQRIDDGTPTEYVHPNGVTLKSVGQYRVASEASDAMGQASRPTVYHEVQSPREYRQLMRAAAAQNPFRSSVDVFGAYGKVRTFISDDGQSMFSIDGDRAVSAVSNGGGGQAYNMLQLAISLGVRRLGGYRTASGDTERSVPRRAYGSVQLPASNSACSNTVPVALTSLSGG